MIPIHTSIAIAALCVAGPEVVHGTEQPHSEIRIKLLDAHTGRPYVNRDVQLFGTNTKLGALPAEDIAFHLQTRTGPDGVARFFISVPLPYRLLPYGAQSGGCAWSGAPVIIAEEVLKSGFVGPNECARKNQRFRWQDVRAEPGEIILFVVEPRGP